MAEVLHLISLPVLVRPSAPAGLQKAPGVTPVLIDGVVVWGALVVRVAVVFDGVVFVRLGFGDVGLAVVSVGLAVVSVGLAEVAVGLAEGLVDASVPLSGPLPPQANISPAKAATPPVIHIR